MWAYEKRLQYPVSIKKKNLAFAKQLVTQYGGFGGELGAALRYLNQRYTMPDNRGKALLTDIGTEEHKNAVYPVDASGVPFTVTYFATTGDALADLSEDMAAEEKARAVYESLIDLTDDADIIGPLLWLRQREIVHFARFKELYDYYKENLPQAK